VVGTNTSGTAYGNNLTFTTLLLPTCTTNPADYITYNSARLNGTVNPNGLATDIYFNYGLTTSYTVATTARAIGSGITSIAVSAIASSLNSNTLYNFRVVGANAAGTNYGENRTFISASSNIWTEEITLNAIGSPVSRWGHSMVYDGTRVIMFGGTTASGPVNDLWWYNPAANTWAQQTPTGVQPPARYNHSMVWDGTRVIMFGGNGDAYYNDLWFYNPAANTWAQQTPTGGPPNTRYGHSMVYDGTRVIMFGGRISYVAANDLWFYNPTANTWAQQTPTGGPPNARYNHSMVWDGTRVIMFGGNVNGTYYNDLWWYNPTNNTWTQQTPIGGPPNARYGHSMVWDGTRVIMYGGLSVQTGAGLPPGFWPINYNDLWWYNPTANTWTEQTPLISPLDPGRSGQAMVWDETRVIMFGGEAVAGGDPPYPWPAGYWYRNDLWWYSP
jgi:fructose-1,6-bisphosphatase